MASYQFVYFMDGVSKTYPGGKKVFERMDGHVGVTSSVTRLWDMNRS